GGQDRVPDVGGAVVLGAADDAHVDGVLPGGQWPVPLDARVRAEEDIGRRLPEEAPEEPVGRGGVPEELVDHARRAVAHEDAMRSQAHAPMPGQGAEPRLVLRRGARERVLVADAGEVIVAGVRVAAPTVGLALGERLVVVTLEGENAAVLEERKDAIWMWAEAAHVAEAKDGLHIAPARVLEERVEGEGVVVHAAEHRDSPVLG